MKKIISILIMFLIILSTADIYGQSIGKQLKNEKKAIEARVKELQKEGWKCDESLGLASTLAKHIAKTNANPNLMELSETSKACKSMTLGKSEARNAVCNEYAEYCGGMLKARITSDLYDVNDVQADNMVAGYERILTKELRKEIKPSYFLYKNEGNRFIVRGTFLIDEEAVERLSKKALEEAAEDAGIALDHAKDISNFIDEGFRK